MTALPAIPGKAPLAPLIAQATPDVPAPPPAPPAPSPLEQLLGQPLPPPADMLPPPATGLAALGLSGVAPAVAQYHAVRARTAESVTPAPTGNKALDISNARTPEAIAAALGAPGSGVPAVQVLGSKLVDGVDVHRNAAATSGNPQETAIGAAAWELAKFHKMAHAFPPDVKNAWDKLQQGKPTNLPKVLSAVAQTAQDSQDSIDALGDLPPQLHLVAAKQDGTSQGRVYQFRYDARADTGVNDGQRWTLDQATQNLSQSEPIETKGGKITPAPAPPSGVILQGGPDGTKVLAPVDPVNVRTLRTLYPSGRKYGAEHELWMQRKPQQTPDLQRVSYLVTHGGSEPASADFWPHADTTQFASSQNGRFITINAPTVVARVPAPEAFQTLMQAMQQKGIGVESHAILEPHVHQAAEAADGFNRPLPAERQQQLVMSFGTPQDQQKAWKFLASHPEKIAFTVHPNERVSDTAIDAYQHVYVGDDGTSYLVHTSVHGDPRNPRNVPVQVEPQQANRSVERAPRLIASTDGIGDAVFGGTVRIPNHAPDKVAARSDAPIIAKVNGAPATKLAILTGQSPAVAYGDNADHVLSQRFGNVDPAQIVHADVVHGSQGGINVTLSGQPDYGVLSAAQRVVQTIAGPRRVNVRFKTEQPQ